MRERINKNVIGMWSALKGLMVLVVILTHSIAEGATLMVMCIPYHFGCSPKEGELSCLLFL